jgi:hypothetical protein
MGSQWGLDLSRDEATKMWISAATNGDFTNKK